MFSSYLVDVFIFYNIVTNESREKPNDYFLFWPFAFLLMCDRTRSDINATVISVPLYCHIPVI